MAEIRYYDEADLQRKITKILNNKGFNFEIVAHDFDLVDLVKKIYVEVKRDNFAPAQILYAIAKNKIKEVNYIALACNYEIRFYKAPPFDKILQFAKKIDSTLQTAPSNINNNKWANEAFDLLGYHEHIYDYQGICDLSRKDPRIFIDQNNFEYFAMLFKKYEINPARFITFLTNVYENNNEIKVNTDGYIININTGEFFKNIDVGLKQVSLDKAQSDPLRLNYKPIKDYRDKMLFESTRITSGEVNNILKQMDRLEPLPDRRDMGRFFTKECLSDTIQDLVDGIKPDYIIEPFVGTGSLIDPIIEDYKGVANDVVTGYIQTLRKKYIGTGWKFTSIDTVITPYKELFEKWEIPIGKNVLILTNPPFGTVSTNVLASKKGELKDKKSRSKKIQYGGLGDKYGRGDLVLPTLAKCIEIIKRVGNGYIATFSPAGVMVGRKRYSKLFGAFLKDFKFIEGHIFSGKNFNSVASKKAIAFTVWKYSPNYNQDINNLTFIVYDKPMEVKELPLLKNGWQYDTRKEIKGEIAVQGNDRFNASPPKMLHTKVEKGGSELIPDNIKIDLKIPNIPTELVYGLWSVSVGYLSITDFPVYFNECYTHLPDFDNPKTLEILAYAVIHVLITELKNKYCEGKIGFIGGKRIFIFGGERLTKGAEYLINTYGDCSIGDKTINEIFNELKNEPDVEKIDDTYRIMIKKEMEIRLYEIGYWDYLPIPEIEKTKEEGILKIPGLGATARRRLEKHGFNTIQKIANAIVDELVKVEGIGEKTAEKYIREAKKLEKKTIDYFITKNK